MDAGTNAREILENKLLPLRRGVLLDSLCSYLCAVWASWMSHTHATYSQKTSSRKLTSELHHFSVTRCSASLISVAHSFPHFIVCQTSFYFPSLCISAWGFFLRCKIMVMTSPILKFRSNDKLKALVNNVKSILLVSQQNKIEQWEVTQCLWRNPYKHKKVGGGKRKSAWGSFLKQWWSQEKEKI